MADLLGIYPFVFACVYSLVLAWVIERRERKYRVARAAPLIPAAAAFMLILFFSCTAGVACPDEMFRAHALLACVLGAYYLATERKYRRQAALKNSADDIVLDKCLEIIAREPSNIYARNRLAELYEARGDYGRAVFVMREVLALENSVQNAWRLKELEEKLAPSAPAAAVGEDTVVANCRRAASRDGCDVLSRQKLVEIYEGRRDYVRAAAVMREIAAIEPSVQNSWKLKELEEQIVSKLRDKG